MLFYFSYFVHMFYCLIFIGTMQHVWIGIWKPLNKYLWGEWILYIFSSLNKSVFRIINAHAIINVYYKYLNLFFLVLFCAQS